MNEIKVIAADIDGTLRVAGGHSAVVSERNLNTIRKLKEHGVLFGIASGRDIKDIRNYPNLWGLEFDLDFFIGLNGGSLYDCLTDSLYDEKKLYKNDLEIILDHMKPLNLRCTFFADDNVHYVNGMDKMIEESIARNGKAGRVTIVDNLDLFNSIGVYKCLFRVEEGKMDEIEAYMKDHPLPKGYSGFKTTSFCYEVMATGINKSLALKKFCEVHNISIDNVMAIGDTTNDNEMLACCYGVCLINGTDDTKACAKAITDLPCDEDGFADYLEKNLFNQFK